MRKYNRYKLLWKFASNYLPIGEEINEITTQNWLKDAHIFLIFFKIGKVFPSKNLVYIAIHSSAMLKAWFGPKENT
jgi:hypothetical protein